MIQRLKLALLALFAAGAPWFAPAARADERDKLTVMTFNEPLEISGQVLPAGTYVLKLLDSQADRNIVQIFTEDQKHLMATIMAIPDYRLEPADKTVVTFDERPSGSPKALHAWFYPGDNYGVEFVYPKSEQQYAAKTEPVVPPPTPAVLVQRTAVKQADIEPEPAAVTEEEVIIAQASPPAADGPVEYERAPALPTTLPQTAGNFAIFPLLGLALLSGGFAAIRFAARQN